MIAIRKCLGALLLAGSCLLLTWPWLAGASARVGTASGGTAPRQVPRPPSATADATPAGTTPSERVPVATSSAERPRQPSERGSAPPPRSLLVQVVAAGGVAQAGAELWWADGTHVPANPGDAPEAASWSERLAAVGERAQCDAKGEAVLSVVGEMLAVHGTCGTFAGSEVFALQPGQERVQLVLVPGDTLVVEAVFDDGALAAGVPMVARWLGPAGEGAGLGLALGATDAAGRLVYPGWRRLAQAAVPERQGNEPVARVGPGVLGVAQEAFALVATEAGIPRRIVVPRYLEVTCQLATLRGAALDWPQMVVELRVPSGQECSTGVTAAGRAQHLVVPGRSYEWSVRGAQCTYGSGQVAVAASGGVLELPCQDVVEVVGVVADAPSGFTVKFQPRCRREQAVAVAAASGGRFLLHLGRHEGVTQLEFQSGSAAALCPVPPLLGAVVDVGVVSLSGAPFAELTVVDAEGAVIRGVHVEPTLEGGKPGLFRAAPVAGAQWRIEGPADRQSLRVVVRGQDCLDEMLELQRGERRRLVLRRLEPLPVTVRVPDEVDLGPLWVRLTKRWSEALGRWESASDWLPVRRVAGVAQVQVRAVRGVRHVLQLWSLAPPVVVAEAEWSADGQPFALDGLQLRSVAVQVDGPGDGYWFGAESQWSGAGGMRLGRGKYGKANWLVLANESEVLLGAASAVPSRVDIRGDSAAVRLVARPASGLPGLDVAHEVSGPTPEAVPAQRSLHELWVAAGRVEMAVQRLSAFAATMLLPCDYEVRIGGAVRVARWWGAGWVVE